MTEQIKSFAILGIKPGHDGSIALIQDGDLKFCFEAEKDNGYRYSQITSDTFVKALCHSTQVPDVLAYGGWSDGTPDGTPIEAGYSGIAAGRCKGVSLLGYRAQKFSSSHERSHILCAYGMSPFEQGRPCYALIWEGHIGSFYLIDEQVHVTKLADILDFPGVRYAFLFGLADPTFRLRNGQVRLSDAGKLMAIAGFASNNCVNEDGHNLVKRILDPNLLIADLNKDSFAGSRFHNCGVTDKEFSAVARLLSDRIFGIFVERVRELATFRLPLLIAGGCALNCEWNSRWIQSDIFDDVFIPPCANDSGSAIGTAIDAQLHYTGNAKISWSPYAGEYPEDDLETVHDFEESAYDARTAARFLAEGKILGWMHGRYEMGPRALGSRSILASPASNQMLKRLNTIKRREGYRPIAPICLEEDMGKYFLPQTASPYMLEFRRVISQNIPAVTHVDDSARPQSVNKEQNPMLYDLLCAFRIQDGISVLCNTSLNFNGRGFLNKKSDLRRFSLEHGLDGLVFCDRLYTRV